MNSAVLTIAAVYCIYTTQGLRAKDITWAYLFSDNFMRMLTYAWVPLQYVLETLEHVVFPAEVKVLLLYTYYIYSSSCTLTSTYYAVLYCVE